MMENIALQNLRILYIFVLRTEKRMPRKMRMCNYTNIYKIREPQRAILSAFYTISPPKFAILLIS